MGLTRVAGRPADTEAQCRAGPGRARGKGVASSSSTFLTRRTRRAAGLTQAECPGPPRAAGTLCLSASAAGVSGGVHSRLASCARASLEVGTVVPTLHVAHPVPVFIGRRESEPTRHCRRKRTAVPVGEGVGHSEPSCVAGLGDKIIAFWKTAGHVGSGANFATY